MFEILSAWIGLVLKTAADANVPEKGRRVVFPMLNNPGNPYFFVNDVEKITDARGKRGWIARVRGKDGSTRTLNSDDPKCQTFTYYGGEPYDWDREEEERGEQEKAKLQQADLVKKFEQEFKFGDRPLRAYEGRKLMVTVNPTTVGRLQVFRDEKLYVDRINYAEKTVDMSFVGEGLEDLSSSLLGIPAAEVIAGSTPTFDQKILAHPVEVINPNYDPMADKNTPEGRQFLDTEMDNLLNLIPNINKLSEEGQATLSARVFQHFQTKTVASGMERYKNDLETFGVEMDEIPITTQTTPPKWAPRGAYTGTVSLHPPFDHKAVMDELTKIAPGYKIRVRRDGTIMVDNISLFKAMMAMGARGPQKAETSWLRPRGVPETVSPSQQG